MNISKVLKNDFTSTQIGTPYYLSPEIWKKEDYSSKADIFSLGCLLYELATLKHPYEAKSQDELEMKVLSLKAPDIDSSYSSELNYLIKKCLTKNPNDRPSADEFFRNKIIMQKLLELNIHT